MPVFLPRHVGRLSALTPDDAGRYSLSGVLVQPREDGSFRLVATDGKRLAIVQGEGAKPDPLTEASLRDGPEGDLAAVNGAAIVPSRDWTAAFKLGGKQQPVGLSVSRAAFLLASGRQTLRGATVDGRYPDYESVLPRTVPLVRFTLNPVLLADTLRVLASMQDPGAQRVEVLFYGPGQPVGLMARCLDGLTFDGLIMPLT